MGSKKLGEIKNVLVIGGQYIARTIVQSLHASRKYDITVVTYPSQTPYLPHGLSPSDITHVTSNFTPESLDNIFRSQDIVISTIAGNDYDFQKRVVDACLSTKVPRFIPNEFGLDSQNPAVRSHLPAYEIRSQVIDYLRSVQHPRRDGENNHPGIEWVAVAMGTILDHDLIDGRLGFDLTWQSGSVPGTGTESLPATSLKRLGDIVSQILDRWERVASSYIYANGCTTSADNLISALQEEMNLEWVVQYVEIEDLQREAKKRVKGGWPDAGWSLLERSLLFNSESVKAFQDSKGNEILGSEPEKVVDIVRVAIHEWRHNVRGDCGCS